VQEALGGETLQYAAYGSRCILQVKKLVPSVLVHELKQAVQSMVEHR
jgi:hypothetical protein